MLHQVAVPSRRLSPRVESPEGVHVFWDCGGFAEISRVRDLSFGGLFIETFAPRTVGAIANLEFLVQEGQVRAEAIVRHFQKGRGIGLKFTAIVNQDRSHLERLMKRLRTRSQ